MSFPWAGSFEVAVADLAASACAVTGIGEDLAAALADVARRVESASAGWRGVSAAVLSVAAQRWSADDGAVLSRLAGHARDLHGSAELLWSGEQDRAGAFGALGSP